MLRGYKLRRVIRTDKEVQKNMSEIRSLQSKKLADGTFLPEHRLQCQRKVHILSYTLHSRSKLKKSKPARTINDSQSRINEIQIQKKINKIATELGLAPPADPNGSISMNQQNDVNYKLIRRYLKNQKNKSVHIAFG